MLVRAAADNLRRYAINMARYYEILAEQSYVCAICGQPPAAGERALAVDHDHNTGKVRGLLCQNCNALLGHAKDNSETLRSAIQYLEETSDAYLKAA